MNEAASTPTPAAAPDPQLLASIEETARELAALAGKQIVATLSREIVVEYKKSPRGEEEPTNPVSEVDTAVEAFIRERLAQRFPDHGIIGEEVSLEPDPALEYLWVIDPVDGTTNFVNGFPLFCASIGVLHRGEPIAGAIWCATSHALRAGVYHASRGGALRFEGEDVPARRPSSGVRRRLIATPAGRVGRGNQWDTRVTGSTALECTFVAAGIFASARFWAPRLWDVAAGVTLVRAAGLEAWTRDGNGRWFPLERFETPAPQPAKKGQTAVVRTLRDWHEPLAIGTPEATQAIRAMPFRRSRWQRVKDGVRIAAGRG